MALERIGDQIGVWMEFVHGRTLEQQLRDHGPLAVDRSRGGLASIYAGALSSVHRAGLIHRDVKAQNVLCDRDGRLVLTDFGATCEQHDASERGSPRPVAIGTPISTAPVAARGAGPATPRKRRLQSRPCSSITSRRAHIRSAASRLPTFATRSGRGRRTALGDVRPDLPPSLRDIIDRAVDPDPRRRFDAPEQMRAALVAMARSTSIDTAIARRSRRELTRRWIALAVVALMLIAGGLVIRSPMRAPAATLMNPEVDFAEIVTLTEHGRLEDAYARALQARAAAPRSPAAASGAAYVLTVRGISRRCRAGGGRGGRLQARVPQRKRLVDADGISLSKRARSFSARNPGFCRAGAASLSRARGSLSATDGRLPWSISEAPDAARQIRFPAWPSRCVRRSPVTVSALSRCSRRSPTIAAQPTIATAR